MPKTMPMLSLAALLLACEPAASAQWKPKAEQIAEAVSAAPESMRADATVLGYRGKGKALVPLREGAGELVCLADDPAKEGFHVACYHKSLEPFMALGRKLRAEGKSREDVQAGRLAAIESGELKMPEQPAVLYNLMAEEGSFDPATGEVGEAHRLLVMYMPYATLEGTGLPAKPVHGSPWLMTPGKPWAHLMVSR